MLGISKATMLARSVLRRCPICGRKKLFIGWAKLPKECPQCGMGWEREQGFFVENIGINTVLSFGTCLVILVIIIVLTQPEIPVAKVTILTVSLGLILPVLYQPIAKGVWLVVDLFISPLGRHEAPKAERVIDVDPQAVERPE